MKNSSKQRFQITVTHHEQGYFIVATNNQVTISKPTNKFFRSIVPTHTCETEKIIAAECINTLVGIKFNISFWNILPSINDDVNSLKSQAQLV
jgi:hypothetical protein